MEAFSCIKSVAAPLIVSNVDTDMIIPKEHLKTLLRTGLGRHLFSEVRYCDDGSEVSDFVLNKAEYRNSAILFSGSNFGCGSSREHAPWALRDFGIRCIIAPSFADIFYNNCFKNSILPIALSDNDTYSKLASLLRSEPLLECEVSLESQTFSLGGEVFNFDVPQDKKVRLLKGLDDIGITVNSMNSIDKFESADRELRPWLY